MWQSAEVCSRHRRRDARKKYAAEALGEYWIELVRPVIEDMRGALHRRSEHRRSSETAHARREASEAQISADCALLGRAVRSLPTVITLSKPTGSDSYHALIINEQPLLCFGTT
jgi:hypothetical protein